MIALRRIAVYLAALPVLGSTSIVSIETTQMQAKITVQTDQSGFCTYRASKGTAFSANIPDLVDNTNTDARSGSLVNAGSHVFVLGTRKGNDALAAASTYWIGVTCGTDTEASAVFTTRPVQWGNTAPDIVPFNSAKFGNMDLPVIDWVDATKSYVDPNTGVEFWRITQPGWAHVAGLSLASSNAGVLGMPLDASGTGKWTNAANITSNGASFAIGNGGPSDKLFIPLANWNCPAGGGSWVGFGGYCNVDDISYDVWCGSGAVSGITLTLQLSIDGGQTVVGNPITTSACPTTAPVKLATYPQLAPQPPFRGWGYSPQRHMIVPPTGTVNTSGTAVTITGSPGYANWANLDWPAGTPVWINGSYAHLTTSPVTSTGFITQENLGTQTGLTYRGANFGVVVTKSNNGSNVTVSIGVNYAYSELPNACCNGDIEMTNLAPVTVSKSADGSQAFNPPLTGYLTYLQSGTLNNAVILFIPWNADGSARVETRLLSVLSKPSGSSRLNCGGDTCSGASLGGGMFFDNQDGNSIYTVDQNGARVWKLTYNESFPGCAGYPSYHPFPATSDYNPLQGPVADDCFAWTNLTPLAGGHDLRSQMISAYQTGLNYLGQTVGSAHTGFDLGWMTNNRSPVAADGGFFSASMDNGQNRLALLGSFDVNSGVLKSVRNTWDEGVLRWGGSHSCPILDMGNYRFCVIDPLDDTGFTNLVFPNRFKANVVQVNRAGAGSTPRWDCSGCPGGPQQNTSVSSTEYYTCPTGLAAPYTSFSGTPNCIQVKVNTPLCQQSPNTTYTFPDGKTEKDEFPCTTPGFGVANAAYSKLQDMRVGDWLFTERGGQAERMVILSIAYNSATDIDLWILRTAGYLIVQPTYGSGDDTSAQGHTAASSNTTHNDPWFVWAAQTYSGNSIAIDVSNPANSWVLDNPLRFSGHGSSGGGALAGTFNYSQAGSSCPSNAYCGSTNLPSSGHVNSSFTAQAVQSPSFAGISGTAMAWSQSYQNATYAANSTALPFFVDFRHLNPPGGGSIESLNLFGNSFTMNLVAGTSRTYRVSGDCCNSSPDYKRWGLQGFAGRFWLKDVSSPATFSSAADMADWSVCLARNSNECVFGSTAGQYYVTVPKHDIQSQCVSGAFGPAIPCVSAFAPWLGQIPQFRVDKFESSGLTTRKFGFAHGHVGLAYAYSNCRTTPDARFLFCPGYWIDGIRTEWLALHIGALPPVDSTNRTTFVPVTLSAQGVPYASNIRARFGYLDNGGNLLHCTAYAQDCSTEIPSAAPSDPFSFTNEAVTRQSCASGATCAITIPSLPNRILYYVVDRLDASGNVVGTGAMQAVAVP
jgi:hypothetical protein